jgi:hypothetical protein
MSKEQRAAAMEDVKAFIQDGVKDVIMNLDIPEDVKEIGVLSASAGLGLMSTEEYMAMMAKYMNGGGMTIPDGDANGPEKEVELSNPASGSSIKKRSRPEAGMDGDQTTAFYTELDGNTNWWKADFNGAKKVHKV